MKIICSYCRKDMGEKEPLSDERTSHGMCPECFDYFISQIKGLSIDEFLDRFDVPILIVDSQVRMVAANDLATKILGRSKSELVGLLGGEIMECAHARLPGGCGHTEHCLGCSIRNTVNAVMQDGVPRYHAHATLRRENRMISLTITAEKVDSFVRLTIEGMG